MSPRKRAMHHSRSAKLRQSHPLLSALPTPRLPSRACVRLETSRAAQCYSRAQTPPFRQHQTKSPNVQSTTSDAKFESRSSRVDLKLRPLDRILLRELHAAT